MPKSAKTKEQLDLERKEKSKILVGKSIDYLTRVAKMRATDKNIKTEIWRIIEEELTPMKNAVGPSTPTPSQPPQ